MSKQSRESTPSSSFRRLVVSSSHNGTNSNGRNMPATTRSMQQRLSSAPQGSSSSVRAAGSPYIPQPCNAQYTRASVNSRDVDSSDDEDEDEEEAVHAAHGTNDDDDDDSEDEDSSDSDSDSDDDDDDEEAVRKMFFIAEPNGFVPEEVDDDNPLGTASGIYRSLVGVISEEAGRNRAFLNSLSEVIRPSSNLWSLLMCTRLRTRWDLIMLRYDQNPSNQRNQFDTANTAHHLDRLAVAIKFATKRQYWNEMAPLTKQQFFGLLLDLLRNIVSRNQDRSQPNRSSRGSTPFVAESAQDVNLYQRMIGMSTNTLAINILERLIVNGDMQITDATQATHLISMYREVYERRQRYAARAPRGSPPYGQDFLARLSRVNARIAAHSPPSSAG